MLEMTNYVQFPNLGISFNISNVAFSIFGFHIYWYGVLIGTGMMLAVLFAFKKATSFGIDVNRMIDVIFIGFVCAIVSGRLYYVIFVDTQYRTLLDILYIRGGGIAIYGAIIGAFLGVLAGTKWRKVPLLPMMDLTSMGFLIGQSLGRWGNFFNQEAFGSNTSGLFGMISPATTSYLEYRQDWLSSYGIYVDPQLPVHPTFLYESLWCALGFLLLWRYSPHRKFNGEITLFYIMWYGAGRTVIEGLRTDSLMVPGLNLRVSQLLGITSVMIAFALWVRAKIKNAGKPLVVPEIPPQTAVVQVPGASGDVSVTISWPANDRAPSKEKKMEMAKEVLAAQEAEKEGADSPQTPDTEDLKDD